MMRTWWFKLIYLWFSCLTQTSRNRRRMMTLLLDLWLGPPSSRTTILWPEMQIFTRTKMWQKVADVFSPFSCLLLIYSKHRNTYSINPPDGFHGTVPGMAHGFVNWLWGDGVGDVTLAVNGLLLWPERLLPIQDLLQVDLEETSEGLDRVLGL